MADMKFKRNFCIVAHIDHGKSTLSDRLIQKAKIIDDRKMKKADVIRMINVDRNYGYQVLNGKRTPTRNFIIQISLILKLSIDEMNYLLQLAGKSTLYVRNLVDARVFYAINHNMDFYDAVDFIWYSDSNDAF